MIRRIFFAMLAMLSIEGSVFAQVENYYQRMQKMTPTEKTYYVDEWNIHVREILVLKEGRLTLELNCTDDLKLFKNMDSVLKDIRRQIDFYKDSLSRDQSENVTIDYVLHQDKPYKEFRFTKHKPAGEQFIYNKGEIAKLKIEQDTIRVIINAVGEEKEAYHSAKGHGTSLAGWKPRYQIQATLYLNNYTDIDKLIANKKILAAAMDTLEAAIKVEKTMKNASQHPLTVYCYAQDSGGFRYNRINSLIGTVGSYYPFRTPKSKLTLSHYINIGVGTVRSTIVPNCDLGMRLNNWWNIRGNEKAHSFTGLFLSPLFFFDRDASGNYTANTNWFLNLAYGACTENNYYGLKNRGGSFGIGYLVLSQGSYFKNTTMKVFMELQLVNGVTLVPEFVATNNFKQVFPGMTVKLF